MARLDSKPCHKSTIHFMDYTIVSKSIGYKNYSEKMKVLSGQCQVWNSRVECRKNPQKGVEIGIITWCRVKDHISILTSATHHRSVMLNLFQHPLELLVLLV